MPKAFHAYTISSPNASSPEPSSEAARTERRIRSGLRHDLAERFRYIRPALREQRVRLDAGVIASYRHPHTASIAREHLAAEAVAEAIAIWDDTLPDCVAAAILTCEAV
jgi:hypothetical protein